LNSKCLQTYEDRGEENLVAMGVKRLLPTAFDDSDRFSKVP